MNRAAYPIVGIGASAGGVDALEHLFQNMPADTGCGFVVVTHLSQDGRSMLPEIIARRTTMPVHIAVDDAQVLPNEIHVQSADSILGIERRRLKIAHPAPGRVQRKPIDVFLSALAIDQGACAVGAILCGANGDGTLGIKAIKARGGLTLAQVTDGNPPANPEMPTSTIATGMVDLAVPVAEMGARIADFARSVSLTETLSGESSQREVDLRAALIDIYTLLRNQIGHDFNGYKPKTCMRRVGRRMQAHRLMDVGAYVELLRQEPHEVSALFRDLLINVTNFFQDIDAFDALARQVIPRLFKSRGADDTVRVWVPGCATGEEVYSIAMLMREYMDGLTVIPRVQLFATDIDDASLSVARAARYPEALLDGVSAKRRERFFHADDGTNLVTKEVRELCIFSAHSVIRDPPFSRLDMVSCRNLLISFGGEMQTQVIPTFHYALRPGGHLFLGSSENATQFSDLFIPVDKKHRIFRRRETAEVGLRLPLAVAGLPVAPLAARDAPGRRVGMNGMALGLAVETVPASEAGSIVRRSGSGEQVQQLENELHDTRDRLQSLIEAHETVLEELKSTNEEMEATKAELQSVSEELHTVNAALNSKVKALDRATADLTNLFESTQVAAVFMDRDMVIRSFTPAMTRIFSILPNDRGRPLTDLASRLSLPRLADDVQTVMQSGEVVERSVSQGGQAHYLARFAPYRDAERRIDGVALTFVDVTGLTKSQAHQRLLIAELNHRVKNMLAVVIGVVEQTARTATDIPSLQAATAGRLHAMARSYELLSRENWTEASVEELVGLTFAPFGMDQVSVVGPMIRLKPRAALSLGMILHELGTNAVKYGALSVPGGEINLSWGTISASGGGRELVVTWQEKCDRRPPEIRARGFGHRLVKRETGYGLGGEASIDFTPDGLVVVLQFPLAMKGQDA